MSKNPHSLFKLMPIWALLVMGMYFLENGSSLMPLNPFFSFGSILMFFLFVTINVGFIGWGLSNIKKTKLNWVKTLGAFIGLVLLIIGARMLLLGGFNYDEAADLTTVFKGVSFPLAMINGLVFYLGPLVFIGLFLLVLFVIGKFCLQSVKIKDEPEAALYSIGVGGIVVSLYVFLLLKLGIFYWFSVLPLLIILALGHRFVADLYKQITQKWVVPFKKISLVDWLLGGVLFVFTAFNFIEALAPTPSGHDDFVFYTNLPRALANGHSFIAGQAPHAFAFLQAIGASFTSTAQLSQAITFSFSLLALAAIFVFIKKLTNSKISFLITVITASLPMIAMHSHLELKVELPIVFWSVLAVMSFHKWLQKSDKKWLFLAGILAGFVFSIKISAAFLLATLVFLLAVRLWQWQGGLFAGVLIYGFFGIFSSGFTGLSAFSFYASPLFLPAWGVLLLVAGVIFVHSLKNTKKKKLISELVFLGIFLGGMFLPFTPWLTNNLVANGWAGPTSLFVDFNSPSIVHDPSFGFTDNCELTGGIQNDYERYMHDRNSAVTSLLMMPWDITMYSSAMSPLLNVGFLFLIFVPFLATKFLKEKFPVDKKAAYWLLMVGFIFYFGLWSLNANGVVWYGISGLILLLLALAGVLQKLFSSAKSWRHVSAILIVVWLLFGLFLRTNFFVSRTTILLPHVTGLINYEQYIDARFSNYSALAEVLNTNEDDLIYLTNANYFLYFIKNNFERVYRDQFLNSFYCLNQSGGGEVFTEQLQKQNIKYVVLSAPIYDPNFSYELLEAQEQLFLYAAENYNLVGQGGQNIFVFELQ